MVLAVNFRPFDNYKVTLLEALVPVNEIRINTNKEMAMMMMASRLGTPS